MIQQTLTVACAKFFGKKPGQALSSFSDEMKALTQKDRNELAEMFKSIDVEVIPLAGKTEI